MRRRWVLPLLVLSGFCGLAYELLWVRLLTLSLGATTASFSIVLAVFFAGLALGSRWGGRRSRSTERPLRTYAILEAITGLLGLVLYPALTHLGQLIASIDPGPTLAGALVRLGVAAVLLLPPTFLMGATLPFISVGTIDRNESTGAGSALIYGLNTLGACVGAAAITFVLLPGLGIFKSTLFTAAINFVVALVAYLGSRGPGRDGRAVATAAVEATPAQTKPEDPRHRVAVLVSAAIGGFVATSAQVVWARFFAITLRGTAYGIGSVLVAVLIGITVGSLVASAASRRSTASAVTSAGFLVLTLLGLISFPAAIPIMNWTFMVFPNSGLAGLPLHLLDLGGVLLFLLLPTVASGAVLPSLITVLEGSAAKVGETLARVYSVNTFGCIVGSLLTGFVLLPSFGSAATLYLSYLLLAAATVLFVIATCRDRRLIAFGVIVVALFGASVFPQNDPAKLQARTEVRQDPFTFWGLQEKATVQRQVYEGDIATVTVSESQNSKGLALNGLGQGSRHAVPPTIAFESTLVATVPWLHAKKHDQALVVGLGAGGTVDAMIKLGVKQVDVAELEKGVVEAVDSIWGAENPLKKPGVTLIPNDARHFLLTTSRRTPHRYDLITSMPAHPWVASALFTREFFELAKENLAPGGVFSAWFGPGDMPDASVEGLFGAFTAAFPHWLVYWVFEAGAFYIVGSADPITFDVARAATLQGHPATAGIDRDRLAPEFMAARVAGAQVDSKPATPKRISTDDNGLIEFAVHRPRTAPAVSALTYFPVRSLPPRWVRNASVDEFMLSVIDHSLGQPRGWLPVSKGVDRRAVEQAGSGLDDAVSPSVQDYLKVRMALVEGKRDDAKTLVAKIADPAVSERAKILVAVTEPSSAATLQALAGISRVDVRALRLALGEEDTGAQLTSLPGPDDDALGILFTATEVLAAAPGPTRGELSGKLMQRLLTFEHETLANRCVSRLEQAGWAAEAQLCREAAVELRRAKARRLTSKALDLGSKGNFAGALAAFVEANSVVPLDAPNANLFLQVAVDQKNAQALAIATETLLARHVHPDTIEGVKRRAVTTQALQKEFPTAKPDAGVPDPL